LFNFLGAPPPFPEPARFTAERYGAFIQAGYHWGDTTSSSGGALMPVIAAAPMNWTGIYIGGYVGGGFSDGRWSDPFGSTISVAAFPPPATAVNVAGFGDKTHATGPLGGGQITANLQTGRWVFGVQGEYGAADLRGENTCFSGIGGVNCQQVVNSVATVAGRVGWAWDRALIYAKAGGAWTTTNYSLMANTSQVYSDLNPLTFGTGGTNVVAAGWVAGGGIEYALTNRWTTAFEYEHIDIGSAAVAFPTVFPVNTQNISVKQTVDVLKLAVNYKLF
jgi:opacity protein-like surface antigen